MSDALLSDLDSWIATVPDPKPSRPEAVRTLMAEGLRRKRPKP
ncbi:MAG: hypothetical protein ABI906_05100 [Pseudomonadota bacterium]